MSNQSHNANVTQCTCPACTGLVQRITSGQVAFSNATATERRAFLDASVDTFCTNLACNFFELHEGNRASDPHNAHGVATMVQRLAGIDLYRNITGKSVQVHFCPCNTQDFVHLVYEALLKIVTRGNLWKLDIQGVHGETIQIRRQGTLLKVMLARHGETKMHMRINF